MMGSIGIMYWRREEEYWLQFLKFRILGEADGMLRMDFVEDVELILGQVGIQQS